VPRLPYKDAADSRVGDLRSWLQRYGAMAPAPALRLAAELCTELGATHKQGGVHGAIEPNNVLLDTARDGGLVAHLRSPETAIADDPAYRPPERDVDAATTSSGDIYTMGCLLWACLTGAPPRAGTHQALRLADGRPAPPELGTLLDGMLRADPADRFRSAGEIGREAAWIADRLDPDGTAAPALRAGAASTSASWKNFGMVGVVGIALLAIAASGYAVVNLVNDPVDPPAQAAPAPAPSSRAPLPTPTPSAIVQKTT